MLYHNQGDGSFRELLDEHSPLAAKTVSRGLAVGDLDNDGRPDVVISDLDGKAQVLRNETENVGHWLQIRLENTGKNRDAIGASIKVRAGKRTFFRSVRSGTSYLSQDALRQTRRSRLRNESRCGRGALARRFEDGEEECIGGSGAVDSPSRGLLKPTIPPVLSPAHGDPWSKGFGHGSAMQKFARLDMIQPITLEGSRVACHGPDHACVFSVAERALAESSSSL